MRKQVIGIGEAAVDHLAVVDRMPEPEMPAEMLQFSIQGSGVVATAIAALAAWKVNTLFVGKVSDDEFGRFIGRGLTSFGVDVSGLVTQPDRVSAYHFVLIDRHTRRRTILRTSGNVDPLTADEVSFDALHSATLLVIDGSHPDVQIEAAERAKRLNVPVVLDASTLRGGMGELVALADVLIASERYATEVAPRGELEDSLVELARMGPKTVVLTMGAEGSIGLEGEKVVRQPSLDVNVLDRTGAGDLFLAGYCYGILHQYALERCMQVASAAAAACCQRLGAWGGIPSLNALMGNTPTGS